MESPLEEREALQLLSTPLMRTPRSNGRRCAQDSPLLNDAIRLEDGGSDDQVSGGTTFYEAAFNMVNVLAGVGALSLPYAFRLAGWAPSVLFLGYLCAVTNYTGKLIGECMGADKSIHTYNDLGSFAFGRKGRIFIGTVLCVELLAALSMFITLMGDNLHKVISHGAPGDTVSVRWLYVASTVAVLPTCLTSRLSLLSKLSVLGIVSTFALLFALVETGLTCPRGLEEGGSFFSLNLDKFDAVGAPSFMPYTVGLEMVGFAGHAVFPSIYDSLEEKEHFPKLVNSVYICTSLLYLSMGFIGYLLFTDSTKEELSINLYDVAGDSLVVRGTVLLTILSPFTKFALTLNPLAALVENAILPARLRSFSGTGMCDRDKITRKLMRTALVVVAMLCSIFLPSFATICAFVGSFCSFIVSAIFPFMVNIRIFGGKMPACERYGNMFMIVVNCLLCALGTAAVFNPPKV